MSDTAESEDKAINQSPSSQSADEGTASSDYSAMTVTELKDIAKSKGLTGYGTLNKAELIALLESS